MYDRLLDVVCSHSRRLDNIQLLQRLVDAPAQPETPSSFDLPEHRWDATAFVVFQKAQVQGDHFWWANTNLQESPHGRRDQCYTMVTHCSDIVTHHCTTAALPARCFILPKDVAKP